MSFAHVIIFKKPGDFDKPLTYHIPTHLMDQCVVGQGVLVELRGNKKRGMIVAVIPEQIQEIETIFDISELLPDLLLPIHLIDLAYKIAHYYQCSLARALKLFIPKSLWQGSGKRTLVQINKASYQPFNPDIFPLNNFHHKLSLDQQSVFEGLCHEEKPILLQGVTGSGKTEIYLRMIMAMAKKGQQSILLVPEIALTPQMIDYFRRYFGDHLALFHSGLSEGRRLHEWFKVRTGYAPLVIGSRSAIFAPLVQPGLVIVDEEHEWTYKQESAPYYETCRVAEMLKALSGCKVIFGSATPRIETFYKTLTGDYKLLQLHERINQTSLPVIQVVDLREEFKKKNFSIFSHQLFSKIQDRLAKKEQIILFVNQRGIARAVICRDCGQALLCPHCQVSLKLHGTSPNDQFLMCHYCAYRSRPSLTCPACGSPNIRHAGIGTQRVEEELIKNFPGIRVVRADKDTTSDKNGFEPIYQAFKKGDYDVLVGTQMIAKGLDFPSVTLIGIVLADIGLHVPDFRSHERLFQLITQVSGRAGRGIVAGDVILQTYQPQHPAIRMAASYDYESFISQELLFRKKLKYPPFSQLIKFTVTGSDSDKLRRHVKEEQEILEDIFKVNGLAGRVISAPAMVPKIGNMYYYQLLLKEASLQIFEYWKPPKGWRIDIDPVHTA